MKLMCPRLRLSLTIFASFLLILGLSSGIFAQKKKSAASKKPVAKKTTAKTKDARKDNKKTKATAKAKDTRRDSKRDKQAAKNSRDKRDRNAKDDRNSRDNRKLSRAERRREEAARRAAALAEQRRREEIARQARERRLAFERGLHTETQANISKDNPDGEDLNVRQAAINALGSRAGTVVVMEAQIGRFMTGSSLVLRSSS